MSAVRYILSLGSHCYPSWLLKRMGLKRFSTPFDWIFSDPLMVADCINDDFSAFLDKQQIISSHLGNGEFGHNLYSEKYQRESIFNHHNPRDSDSDYEYFVRAATRFSLVLRSRQTKLFVCLAAPSRLSDAATSELLEALNRSTSHFYCLFIECEPSDNCRTTPLVTAEKSTNMFAKYKLVPTSPMINGLSFEREADNEAVSNLLSGFNFELAADPLVDFGRGTRY
jgi:Putative papain-like cysteine peptidase (DUF1796)